MTLAQAVATEGIDVLIHNAGVAGRGMAPEEVQRRHNRSSGSSA